MNNLIVICGSLFSIAFICFGSDMFSLFYGDKDRFSYEAMIILSAVPMLGLLTILWGDYVLVSLGGKSFYMKIIIYGSVLSILVMLACAQFFDGATAAAIAALVSHSFLCYKMKKASREAILKVDY